MQIYTWLLPFYVLGNFHCFSMCGPLAFLLAKQSHRYLYFVGRIFSFAIGGFISGALGQGLSSLISLTYIPQILTLGLCLFFIALGFYELGLKLSVMPKQLGLFLSKLSLEMATWVEKGNPFSLFLFGLATLLLPCGQSWMLFSALALYGEAFDGLINGALFALITTPSLYLAMVVPTKMRGIAQTYRNYTRYALALFWWANSAYMFYRLALIM